MGKAVGLFIENLPGDFPPEIGRRSGRNQLIILLGSLSGFLLLRIDLHQTNLVRVLLAVVNEKIGNRHNCLLCMCAFRRPEFSVIVLKSKKFRCLWQKFNILMESTAKKNNTATAVILSSPYRSAPLWRLPSPAGHSRRR